MSKLTRLERETILSFNDDEPAANVYTASPVVARRLEKRLGRPADRKVCLGWEWDIPRRWVTLPRARVPRPASSAPQGFARRAAAPPASALPS